MTGGRAESARSRVGSVTVVGTGLCLAAHLTAEALHHIEAADKVFYNLTNAREEDWIMSVNKSAVTLKDCYASGKPRVDTYRDMAARILDAVRQGARVCVVFYGHPGVFANATHASVRQARQEGFEARILPAVSAEDCLFADLGIDPGTVGCQSFEASDFLLRRRRFDPTSVLILWQVGILGERSVGRVCPPHRLRYLAEALEQEYSSAHQVVLYQAAHFPSEEPVIRTIRLSDLETAAVSLSDTMCVPPLAQRAADPRAVECLCVAG